MNYIYPDNLRAKATLWLWELRDIVVIGVGGILAIVSFSELNFTLPAVLVALYAFLSIRFEDTSILDFLRGACAFFISKQQYFEWRMSACREQKTRKKTGKRKVRASS